MSEKESPRQPLLYSDARDEGKPGGACSRPRKILLAIVFVAFFLFLGLRQSSRPFISQRHHRHQSKRTNVILMISDGYGPASETFGRSFHQALKNNTSPTAKYKTPLDRLLVGSHRSRSSDSLITDSAAGATAFSCAIKSYNGAIGVDAEGELCATVFEGAKEKGMLTGVVVTSRLTDATPACFFAHVPSRAQESTIATQALGLSMNGTRGDATTTLDLAIGGGGCYFLPSSDPFSCRQDEIDVVSRAKLEGWSTRILFKTQDEDDLRASNFFSQDLPLPLLALLAPFNTPYEIDRAASQPSLSSLALKALETLDRSPKNDKGFLIMIEGSQIDLCAHQNDPACHAREIEAYQQAIEKVGDWVNKKNEAGERTILISTSDHETGGVTLGRQLGPKYPNYAYYPQTLIGVKESAASLSSHLLDFARSLPLPSPEDVKVYIRDHILIAAADFTPENGGLPSADDVERVFSCLATTPTAEHSLADPPIDTADDCRIVIADLISQRAEIGWSTSGHTGVDVPVHVLGSNNLKGNMENTDIGAFIARTLSIDLVGLTERLKRKAGSGKA
ncbi:hypothetical protein CBS101457_003857 [Exobasidium rhododendri]|nr:hypothetical protein CBS101457_003857 [Exobasidium rhododendri]